MPRNPKRSKPLANGRDRHGGKHVRLYAWEMNSPAYRSLSAHGRAALLEVRLGFNGSNNGAIVLSVRQLAERLSCHRDTAGKALRELEAKGFIRAKAKGSFSQKQPLATCWILTNEPYGDALATRDFMRWESG